ncbi:MAG: hypothetical protein AUI15_33900 [Actinobacteria bacterium 13_2_20CM_2_66_6]|nr:MAG: hypothetical protein AUI15_33900 [Actinobacteria bacterium 13_2_20CM_2_66_6]
MQREAVYDLTTCTPHERDDARYTAVEYAAYVEGYTLALVMALRVMDFAEERWHMHLRTKRLEAKQKRERDRCP